MNYLFLHYTSFRHKVHLRLCVFFVCERTFWRDGEKKLGKNLVVSFFFLYFAAERASYVPLCGASVPCLIGKIEALCSSNHLET